MAYYTWKSYKLTINPINLLKALGGRRNCFFLDSSLSFNSLGRYSFLGIDPYYILRTKNQLPFEKLRERLNNYKINAPKNMPPFLGGAVGYLGYDIGFLSEKRIRRSNLDDLGIPDTVFCFYNTILIIDNFKRTLHIFAIGFPEKKYHLQNSLVESNLKKLEKLLSQTYYHKPGAKDYKNKNKTIELKSNFHKDAYLQAVKRAKEYIKSGDIYQVNLSQRFHTESNLSGIEIYERLRKISPSFFSAYFDAGGFRILSSSPERFLKLEGGIASTRPMKGTRPRGTTGMRDLLLRNQLLASSKDRAELTMIVDLERNDLGRVCKYDSIKVDKLRELEEYNTVFQTTATVSGRLHKNKDRIDLLRASFPGGSITGCPKLRAMEIIEELEPDRRYIYTGSLGYLSFCGNMDFNILIRTILKRKNSLYFSVGGGIVADSQPEAEYRETLVKARAMIRAISG
ncbi:MAG: aminodeoxychorismate synthase component I [Candidatus Omnitrophota bacterium]